MDILREICKMKDIEENESSPLYLIDTEPKAQKNWEYMLQPSSQWPSLFLLGYAPRGICKCFPKVCSGRVVPVSCHTNGWCHMGTTTLRKSLMESMDSTGKMGYLPEGQRLHRNQVW